MSSAPLAAGMPIAVENPEDWPRIASVIERRTGTPPVVELPVLVRFLGDCIARLFEAEKEHNPEMLRGSFSDEVIGKLLHLSLHVPGWTAVAADVLLIGAPEGLEHVVLRTRARVQARGEDGQTSVHEQFWDLAMGDLTTTVGATSCPNCGAPLPKGALACAYCHTDTRSTAHVPLQVVRLERLS
jgi:hypothetical protein